MGRKKPAATCAVVTVQVESFGVNGLCPCGFAFADTREICWKCNSRPCQNLQCGKPTGSAFLAFCFPCDLRAQEQEREELKETLRRTLATPETPPIAPTPAVPVKPRPAQRQTPRKGKR